MTDLRSLFGCCEHGQDNVCAIVCDWPVFKTVGDMCLHSRNLSNVVLFFLDFFYWKLSKKSSLHAIAAVELYLFIPVLGTWIYV